jgi:hypothetical protein
VAITAPDKDANGHVAPHDHPELTSEGRLIRRISPLQVVDSPKGRRLSSAVLEPSTTDRDPYCGLSVDLEQLLLADNVDAIEHVKRGEALGAIALTVSCFRDRHFLVGFDPQPNNDYHGNVWQRPALNAKLTRGMRNALLREAEWFITIDGVAITTE